MNFEIKDKVALVTGGASGIGLEIVKALLNNDIKGITIADINSDLGNKVALDLNQKFGPNRILFVQTDVTNLSSFENAFKKTIDFFKHVDILFNNAGYFDEVQWEKTVDINLKGVINGILLGIENYLQNHNNDNEALIVNTASITGLCDIPMSPIYGCTKHAVIGLTRSYGHQRYFESTKVRTIAICPGVTLTPLIKMAGNVRPICMTWAKEVAEMYGKQSTDWVANETIKLVKKAPTGTAWVIEDYKPAYEYIFPERGTFEKNTLE